MTVVDSAFCNALVNALRRSGADEEYVTLADKLLFKKIDLVRYFAKVAQLQWERRLWGGSEVEPFWPWNARNQDYLHPPECGYESFDPRYRLRRIPRPESGTSKEEKAEVEKRARAVRDENNEIRAAREDEVLVIEAAKAAAYRDIKRWATALTLEMMAVDMKERHDGVEPGTHDEARRKIEPVLCAVENALSTWNDVQFHLDVHEKARHDTNDLEAVFDERSYAKPQGGEDEAES